jgi:hypothetical protein
MMHVAALTQAPHAARYNGGTAANARQLFIAPTQRQAPHGPRIDAAIAGMLPGEIRPVHADVSGGWVRVVAPDRDAGTFSILDWTVKDLWHAPTQQLIRGGRRIKSKVEVYSDLTGENTERAMPPAMGRATGSGHWYGETALDPSPGGLAYLRGYAVDPATWEWRTLPATKQGGGTGSSYAWMTNAAGGRGRLAKYGDAANKYRLGVMNPDTWAWDFWTGSLFNDHHALVEYHPVHSRLLVVGGSGTLNVATLVDHLGAAIRVRDCPAPMGQTLSAWIVPHPAGCWLVRRNGVLWAFWPVEDRWDNLGPAPDAGLMDANAAFDAERGIVLLTHEQGLHVYKLPTL